MPITLKPETGSFTRTPRVENPFLNDEDFNTLPIDDEDGLGFDVHPDDALEVFPVVSVKDASGKYVKRNATDEEALEKYLALLNRQLTEAGEARTPPVTIRRSFTENGDGTYHVFFKARPKVKRGESEEESEED